MFLQDLNYRQVEEYLKTSDTIIIPVGSCENHGLHLPLGTDTIVPDHIAKLIDSRCDVMIAPSVNYGVTEDLACFAGTVSIGTEGLTNLLQAICDGLYRHGFRHFMILNGHGGNNAAIQNVGMNMYRKGAYLACLNWWLMAGQINPEWAGGHGGGEETAAVMAVNPDLIKTEHLTLPEGIKNDLGDSLPYGAWTNVNYKGVSITIPREIDAITDNGWLVHSFKGDVPTRANAQWGGEMLTAVADFIVDFGAEFAKTELPKNKL
ncbi:MAG: creatininase family protein [Oscillospiraceae bacterium]|nr:creatininase family protein [Oscillospiraceae bacterium]